MRLDGTDIGLICLGIKNGGSFDEKDIAGSSLNRLGSGRILDALGSLVQRKLVTSADGAFHVTDAARQIMWDDSVPLDIRILRLLRSGAYGAEQISEYLQEPDEAVSGALESLRRDGLAMVSPMRSDGMLLRLYEILPDGLGRLDADEAASEIPQMLGRVRDIVERSAVGEKQEMLEILDAIKERLSTLSAGGPGSGRE